MIREYKTIREISGPLMVVDRVQGVTYDELAEIQLADGSVRRCKVLEVNGDSAVVQLFEASAGINLAQSKIRFLGHPLQLAVSGDMLGRVFNGMGQPIDGGPAIGWTGSYARKGTWNDPGTIPTSLSRRASLPSTD